MNLEMDCHVWEYLEIRKEKPNFFNNLLITVDFENENVQFQ